MCNPSGSHIATGEAADVVESESIQGVPHLSPRLVAATADANHETTCRDVWPTRIENRSTIALSACDSVLPSDLRSQDVVRHATGFDPGYDDENAWTGSVQAINFDLAPTPCSLVGSSISAAATAGGAHLQPEAHISHALVPALGHLVDDDVLGHCAERHRLGRASAVIRSQARQQYLESLRALSSEPLLGPVNTLHTDVRRDHHTPAPPSRSPASCKYTRKQLQTPQGRLDLGYLPFNIRYETRITTVKPNNPSRRPCNRERDRLSGKVLLCPACQRAFLGRRLYNLDRHFPICIKRKPHSWLKLLYQPILTVEASGDIAADGLASGSSMDVMLDDEQMLRQYTTLLDEDHSEWVDENADDSQEWQTIDIEAAQTFAGPSRARSRMQSDIAPDMGQGPSMSIPEIDATGDDGASPIVEPKPGRKGKQAMYKGFEKDDRRQDE